MAAKETWEINENQKNLGSKPGRGQKMFYALPGLTNDAIQ